MFDQHDLTQWLLLVEQRHLRVGIIGLGYVGLPLVLLFSQEGFKVTGFDIDAAKVDRLNAGESYIHRIEAEQIREAQAKGFRATADFAEVQNVDAILICVPTPLSDHHTPDMSFIEATMTAIAGHLRPGQLVVLESTTYPGTTEELIAPAIERAGKVKVVREHLTSDGILVAYSPEREDPGNTSIDRRDIPKVVGGVGPFAAEAAAALYNTAFHRVVRVSTPGCRRDDQAVREHLPLRKHRARQRTQAAVFAHGH